MINPITSSGFDMEVLAQALEKSMAVLECAPDGTILNANTIYLTISGYTHDEIIGKNHKELCPTEYVISDAYRTHWENVRAGTCRHTLLSRRRANGSPLWLVAVYHTTFSRTGEPTKITKFCLDVTAHIESMRKNTIHMKALDSSLIMAEYSTQGAFTAVNDTFVIALGYSESDLIGKQLCDFFSLHDPAGGDTAAVWDSIRSGHTYTHMCTWSTADNTPLFLETIFAPVFSSDGSLLKIIQTSLDVSMRIAAENKSRETLQMLALVAGTTGNPVVITDRTNKIVYVNESFSTLFGYTLRDVYGKMPTGIFGPAEKDVLNGIRVSLSARGAYQSVEMAYARSGRRMWVSLMVNPVFSQEGKHTHTVAVFTDITDTKLHAFLQHRALEAMAHDVPAPEVMNLVCREVERIMPETRVAVLRLDNHGKLYFFSAPSLPLKDMSDNGLASIPDNSPSARAIASGCTISEGDFDTSSFSDEIRRYLAIMNVRACLIKPIFSGTGRTLGTVGLYHSHPGEPDAFQHRVAEILSRLCAIVLEREESRATMRRLAFYHSVTGLPNRTLLLANAEQTIASIRPHLEIPFAIICINIDRFKLINSACGHDMGNEILKTAGKRITELKGAEDIVAHITADEFVIFLTNCNAAQALDTGRRIQAALSNPITLSPPGQTNIVDITLSATIGISLYPDNGRSVEFLISYAQKAMLQAKKNGQSQLCFFSEDLHKREGDNLPLEARLRKAIAQGGLCLHYQPQLTIKTGKLHGIEALCRWKDEEFGNISPARFIPLAEDAGLIAGLSHWVLREACRQLGMWHAQGLVIPTVSVNLSSSNFHDTNLPDKILSCLKEHNLEPKNLILELTESVLLDEDPTTMSTIRKAHGLGLLFSLDDFGTGYSSLSYLRHLPISEIKLDQCFVRDLACDGVSRRLSKAVVRIGESLDLPVVAEGVENKEQLAILKRQRCQIVQGYLFSAPLPAEELTRWVREWTPASMQTCHALA